MLVTLDLTTQASIHTHTHTHTHTCMLSCSINVLLCIPTSYRLPGYSAHGILQARVWRGCHALLWGIFPSQGLNPHLLCLLHWRAESLPLAPPGKPCIYIYIRIYMPRNGISGLLRRHQRAGSCSSFSVSASLPLSLTPLHVRIQQGHGHLQAFTRILSC